MIYFDQAATSYYRPDCVVTAVIEALANAGNSSRSATGPSIWSSRIVYEAREKIATLFNAKPENVAFTSGVTESLNLVIASFFNKGHIITTANDHNSVLRPLYLRDGDLDLTIIPVDKDGNFEYELMERAFRPDTLAVITTGASNVTGNLMDIQRIGTIAYEHNALFILDAAQVAGLIPIDMENFNIDILCFTGHKELFAPQGTGGIVLREGLHPVPVKVGGSGFYSFAKNHPDMMPNVLSIGVLPIAIAEIVIAIILGVRLEKMNPITTKILYIGYAILTGLTFSTIFIYFEMASLISIFIITAVIFGLLAFYGYVTKRDLTKLGTIIFIGLIGIVIGELLNWLIFKNATLDLGITIIGVLIFVGYIAYDVNRIKYMVGYIGEEKAAVYGAFQLYLDFINLFIRLLQLFGKRND